MAFLFLSSDIGISIPIYEQNTAALILNFLWPLALTFSTTISPGSDIYAAPNGLSQI